jgi:L-amino acid N-acyltransferase YncA
VITYAIESLAAARPDIEAILGRQWRETGEQGLDPSPLWMVYEELERRGGFLLVARRDGWFAGYLAAAIHRHINAYARVATISTYWVEPCPGRAFVLRGLLRAALAHLATLEVTRVTVDTEAGHSAGRLLAAMGFREAKISYTLAVERDVIGAAHPPR